jgi:DNA ligase-1
MFDLLYLNGKAFVKEPLIKRRSLLHENFNEVEGEFKFARGNDTSTMEEVQVFLEESVKGNSSFPYNCISKIYVYHSYLWLQGF